MVLVAQGAVAFSRFVFGCGWESQGRSRSAEHRESIHLPGLAFGELTQLLLCDGHLIVFEASIELVAQIAAIAKIERAVFPALQSVVPVPFADRVRVIQCTNRDPVIGEFVATI